MRAFRPPICCGLTLMCVLALVAARPGVAAEGKPAAKPAKITFEEHIRPIFREHCASCHNQNKARNDLALDSYDRVMKGGASGDAVKPGDLEESYLWKVVTHQDEPKMPPGQDKIPEAKLTLIKAWIEGGAPKDSGSAVVVAQPKPKLDLALASGAAKPAGGPIIPAGLGTKSAVKVVRAGPVVSIAASPWSPVIALGGHRQVVFYRDDNLQPLGIVPFDEGVPYALRFSRSGAALLAAGGHAAKQGRAVAYDVRNGKRLFAVGDELDAVLGADIDKSHAHVALGGPDRLLRVYSADGAVVHQLKKHTDWILAVEYSPDGVLLASADRSGGLVVWEAESGQEYQSLDGHQGPIHAVSWRDDGNVLASGSEDGTVRLWEMQDGKQIRNVKAHDGGVLAVKFAHDGRLVTAGRDKRVKIWSVDGKPLHTLGPLADIPLQAVFNHDDTRVITGDWSGQVIVWDAAQGKELGKLTAYPQ